MSELDLDFYKSLQSALRTLGGKALPAAVKRWRYMESSDAVSSTMTEGTARFLSRFGILDSGREAAVQLQAYQSLLQRISRSTGEAPGIVSAWLRLFADGQYGVLERGICSDEPQCAKCPLQERCRFLSAGGRDSRTFEQSLAESLAAGAGDEELRTADLLAFVLSGEKCGSAERARAQALLREFRGLRGLFQATPEALRLLNVDARGIARLHAISELCRLWAGERNAERKTFACGKDFFDEYHLRLRDKKKEVFIVVALDQKNGFLDEEEVSVGTLTETLVHPREVFANAIACRAASIAVLHNHPSGDPTPSTADKAITKRLETVAKMMGIRLLDHVIIGDGRFVSFVESRLLG
ncbi:MAG TPA: DNA repair protein RadC [Planctomycetota bacterium]|nr:DNA repair protein RadC [Planctomycetota bacterium]